MSSKDSSDSPDGSEANADVWVLRSACVSILFVLAFQNGVKLTQSSRRMPALLVNAAAQPKGHHWNAVDAGSAANNASIRTNSKQGPFRGKGAQCRRRMLLLSV